MTPEQIELGRHDLGLPNKRRESYRNHFCAGPGHDDYAQWLEMVVRGYAIQSPPISLYGEDVVFRLTMKGAKACLKPREKLSQEDFSAEGKK